jgi:hypothetical protein
MSAMPPPAPAVTYTPYAGLIAEGEGVSSGGAIATSTIAMYEQRHVGMLDRPQGGFSPTSWRTDFFVFNPIGRAIAWPGNFVAPFWQYDGQQVNPISGEVLSIQTQQDVAVLSTALGAAGALRGLAAKGTATVIEHAGSHASVLVRSGNTVLHTEQIVGAGGQTTIAVVENAAPAVRSLTVSLPDAAAAMRYQQSVVGQATGVYNAATNSCVTHCGDVLRAGGARSTEHHKKDRNVAAWFGRRLNS